MFPNVRLLIGALFITVLVLSCEFGVFAALRVNREPLSRLTSESAPLQLIAGKNAPAAMPISWSGPRDAQAHERAIEVPVPSNDGADGTVNNNDQPSPPGLQTALAPLAAAPAPAIAPAADAAAPIAQAPTPPPAKTPIPGNQTVLANPDASIVPAQEVSAPAIGASVDNGVPEQAAVMPAEQTPAAEIVKPSEAAPQHAAPAPEPQETAARAGEPPAASAPLIAAIAPAAAEPAAIPPAEFTGSVPNAAIAAPPKAKLPHAKPLSEIVHKPAAKKPHKIARAPAQPHHPVKKRIARARPAAAASTAQPATDFNNPVFQSAPEFQRPRRSRAAAKTTATNNGFGNSFGSQFGTR